MTTSVDDVARVCHEANRAYCKTLHEKWCEEKRADGWVYGDKKDAEAKTHPCLMPWLDLPPEQQRKDVLFQAVCRALLEES